MLDKFKTITSASEVHLYKIKNSKFFGFAFPVTSEEEIKGCINKIKKEYYDARHWCYAWRLGVDPIRYRANDDGEPSNTAGQPILGQLQSFEVTNVLLVVVRYFGGVKLGVGGLISAYRTTAQECLETCSIIEKRVTDITEFHFQYPLMNEVMRKVKQHQFQIINQDFQQICKIWIETPKSETIEMTEILNSIYGVEVITEN